MRILLFSKVTKKRTFKKYGVFAVPLDTFSIKVKTDKSIYFYQINWHNFYLSFK